MKLVKSSKKALAILLAFLIAASVIPISVSASQHGDSSVEYATGMLNYELTEEVIEKRDEFSKTYLLEDNTYYEIISPIPIHENNNGEWVEPEVEIEQPTNTQELLTYCDELSETVVNNDTGISTASFDVTDTSPPTIAYRLVNNNLTNPPSQLTNSSILLLKIPHDSYASNYKNKVTIDCQLQINLTTDDTSNLYVHAIENSWDMDDSSLKKRNIDYDVNSIEDYSNISTSDTYSWDITNLYMQWEKGTMINNGIVIRSTSDASITISGAYITRRFKLINYYDSDFTYHNIDMGRAGIVYINDYTNTITLAREEIGFDSNILPITLSRYFDFSVEHQLNNPSGEGAHWNYDSKLSMLTSLTYSWEMFDGSIINFIPNSGIYDWKDENNSGYSLTLDTKAINQNDYSDCQIITPEEIVYNFNASGKVESITDVYNNTIQITYKNNLSNLIDYIVDGLGRKYNFIYENKSYANESGNIQINTLSAIQVVNSNDENIKISDSPAFVLNDNDDNVENDIEVNIKYNYILLPNGHIALSEVIYPDGETVRYEYEGELLSKVYDVDGRCLTIEYATAYDTSSDGTVIQSTSPCVINLIEEVVNVDDDINSENYDEYLLKSSLNIDRHNSYQRTFTDHTGKKEIIQYNTNLKMLYYQNNIGEAFYADYSDDEDENDYLSQILSPEDGSSILENYDLSYEDIDYWSEVNSNPISVEDNIFGDEENYVIKVAGSATELRGIKQNVAVVGEIGDIYVVGSWAKLDVPIPSTSHFAGIEIYGLESINGKLELRDATTPIYSLSFDPTIDNEAQFRLGAFKLSENVDGLQFRWVYLAQSGTAYFDDALLYKSTTDNVSFFQPDDEIDDVDTSTDNTETIITYNEKGLTISEQSSMDDVSMLSQYSYNDDYFNASWIDNNNVTTNYIYDSGTGTLSQKGVGNNITTYKYTPVGALKEVSTAVSGLTDNISNIKTTYTYSDDRIESIVHNNTTFHLNYNSFGNVKSVQINPNSNSDSELISYNYSMDYKQTLNSIEYANGDKLFYTYDDNTGNVLSILSNDESSTNPNATKLLYEYNYNSNGELVTITDYDSNRIIEYTEIGHTIKEFTVSDTQELIIGRTISTFAINDSGNKVVTLFGNEFTTQTSEAVYNESSNETTYATECYFNIAEGPITFKSQSVSDYFGRIRYSQISAAMNNAPESTHNIKNSYTYKDYSTSVNGETVTGTTNLIQSCTSEVFTAQSGNFQDTLVSLTTSYQYDNAGRITHIFYNQGSESIFATYYRYDTAGQLILEYDDLKEFLTEYTYDSHGNLTSKTIYQKDQIVVDFDEETYTVKENEEPQIITYNYGNTSNSGLVYSDVLTSVLDSRVSDEAINISYDNSGNPLNSFMTMGDDLTSYTLEWDGALLKSITNTESEIKCDYSYDNNGIRTKKTFYEIDENGTVNPNKAREINYIWDDGLLVGSEIVTYETVTDSNDGTTSSVATYTIFTKTLYDEYDNPVGVYYKSDLPEDNDDDSTINILPSESVFWFIKDGQGNVKAMIADSNDYALGCSYDAYGNISLNLDADFIDEIQSRIDASDSALEKVLLAFVGSIATAVSIESALSIGSSTYRGYMFDTESGLLYCQNRYYSPTIGRFINMDDPSQLTENMEDSLNSNLYAYCGNDPINNVDPTGRSKYTLSAVGMQAEMSASLLSFAGAVGIEFVYVWSKNAMYAYYYYGNGAGVGYTNSAINYLKNSLKNISMSPKVSLKNISNMFRLNWSITIGFFAAFTDKKFSWPNSYVGNSKSTAISIGKAKGYKATGTGCNVYGICYSVAGNSGFSVSTVNAKYKRIQFNTSAIKSYLSSQKNVIKKAVE